MRAAHVFVLPSFYEGLPLVLVEALACGCRLVCTDLPGVRSGLLPHLEPVLDRVPMPALAGIDPGLVGRLESELEMLKQQKKTPEWNQWKRKSSCSTNF